MPLTPDEEYLAKNCYGYGRWDAPYWFIGLEERLTTDENNDRSKRATIFREINKDGLCDCQEFHHRLGETAWKYDLQFTWGRLIRLLKEFQGLNTDNDSLLNYQRDCWGSKTGETCVTELSGLPADSSNEGRASDKERFRDCQKLLRFIRDQRIDELSNRIRDNRPKLVVFYGKTQRRRWDKIAGERLLFDGMIKSNNTHLVFAPHPNMRGRTTEDWDKLATVLRNR